MKLAFLVAAWLAGVLIGLETSAPLLPLLLLMGGSVTFGLALRLRSLPVFPALLALLLVLGVWRGDSVFGPVPVLTAPSLAGQSGAEITLAGRIGSDPEFSGSRVRFELEVRAVKAGSEGVSLDGRILVFAIPPDDLVARRSPPYFDFGDIITVTGTLRTPEPFGGFDYPAYLAGQGITEIMSAETAEVVGGSGGWRKWPYAIRGRLSESIEDTIPYPQSALGQALLLGLKADLPPGMVEDFRSTGTSHLLAISGLHVGVLVVMFLTASSWLFGRRGFYFLAVPLVAVWAYALVTGLPPSVVRAAVMGTMYLAATAVGRPGSILPALAFSAGAMTAVSPEIIQRVSFQLKFRRHDRDCADTALHTALVLWGRWPVMVDIFSITPGPCTLNDAHPLLVRDAGDLAAAGLQLPGGRPARHHSDRPGSPGDAIHHGRDSDSGGGRHFQRCPGSIHWLAGLGAIDLHDRDGRSGAQMDP